MEMNIISIIVMLGAVWITAFFLLSSLVWTLFIGAVLLTLTLFLPVSVFLLCLYWLLFIAAVSVTHLRHLRQRYIVKPAVAKLKKQMPSISNTEREAIEAGNPWWEKELLCGRPNWKNLFKFPQPRLTSEEQNFIDNQVETLCKMLNDWDILVKDKDLSPAVWEYLKKEKFFGLVIPKQYGGLGFSALAHSTIVVKIATRSMSTAVNMMVPNSLGPGELLAYYGTEEQKNYYLPRLARGEEVPCFALTGPEAGSDAGAIPDSGVICRGQYQGQEVLGIRLNWNKRYITLAPIATLLGLAFQLYDPDHLLGNVEHVGITLCLLPTSLPGVEIGNRHYPAFQTFMNGPTSGKDVFIPLDWIIGGSKMAGKGWRMLMECLSIGRSISLPALSTATSKIIYRFTGAYSRIRRQFNTPIAAFEGVEEALAEIAGNTYITEATRIMTAGAVDMQVKPSIASAITKYHLTELSRYTLEHALDIHAGHMIQVGPRNFLFSVHTALPISITVEGANILTRNLIIFGQGAIRCHPYLLTEVELISEPIVNIKALDKVLMQHVGFFISNLLRSFAYGLTGGIFIFTNVKNKQIKKYQRQLTRMSASLALIADSSLILLGGSLKLRERISARLGDVMSQLYLASAVLKYYNDNGCPETDVDYVCWSLQTCLQKIQVAMNEFFNNFPNRFVGIILRFIVFPFGHAYLAPKDELSKKIVKAMLTPSSFRDRLTKYCFISTATDDIEAQLEKGLKEVEKMDVIWKKLNKAAQEGIIPQRLEFRDRVAHAEQANYITADEARAITSFDALRAEIIKVNEFSFDLEQVIA